MPDSVPLEVILKHRYAKLPFRKRDTDAGYDIYSVEDKTLAPGRATIVCTGIHIAAPTGFYYTIEGRSSLWRDKRVFPNRGIIDATYTGEVVVSLVNVGEGPYQVSVGDRIAQILLHKQYHAEFIIVEEFSPHYNQRGNDGFGSSGK